MSFHNSEAPHRLPAMLYNQPSASSYIGSQGDCGRAQTLLSIFLSINFYYKNKFSYLLLLFFNPSMAYTTYQKKKRTPKRKIMDEGRLFSEKWIGDYFFVQTNNKVICLIRRFVYIFKDYNLEKHYMQKHAAKFSAYEGLCH